MIWLVLSACGQFVSAPDALENAGGVAASVDLPSRDALAEATTLRNYGLDSMLREHTAETEWNGGEIRLVDYDAMNASIEASVTLSETLATLATVDPSNLENKDERLAYWLNLYNSWTIQAVLTQRAQDPDWTGAESSVWDGEDTGIPYVMFDTTFVAVGEHLLTLNQVEHGIMRGHEGTIDYYFADDPAMQDLVYAWHDELWEGGPVDARIHMGLNCASYGCPDILDGAFIGARVGEQLDASGTRFLGHSGKGAGPDGISNIFSWFADDFAGSHGSVEEFVAAYREGGDADVDYDALLEYDWSLNVAE